MVTEIYSCLPGQAMKEGRVEYSDTIDDRDAAEYDAKLRIDANPAFEKIAYYRINENGDFRIFYTYKNPNVKASAKPAPKKGGAVAKRKKAGPKKKKKMTLFQKIIKAFGFGK